MFTSILTVIIYHCGQEEGGVRIHEYIIFFKIKKKKKQAQKT